VSKTNGRGCDGVLCRPTHSEALQLGGSDFIHPMRKYHYFLHYFSISIFSNKFVISNNLTLPQAMTVFTLYLYLFCCIQGSKYRGADKSLARPTSRCVLFDG
jgi:hypothetical protein